MTTMPRRFVARHRASLLAAALAWLAACSAPHVRAAPVFHAAPDAALQTLPFAEAVEANGFLFVSGVIGVAPGTLDVVPGGIVAEAKQTMASLQLLLARHGCTFADVVKCTVFLADMGDWPAFNEVYRGCFVDRFPARSALGANGLARGARVEVDCIAVLPAGAR
jgi:reactive intermediate/imine deaminase